MPRSKRRIRHEIVDWRTVDGVRVEVLACGHLRPPPPGALGNCGQTARVCEKCRAGQPPDELPPGDDDD